ALVNKIAMEMYVSEVKRIAAEGSGLHFNAVHANVQQLEEFDIDRLAWRMKWDALCLWGMLGATLLTQEAWRMGPVDLDDQTGEDDEDTYHDALEGCDMRLGELTGRPIRQHAVATIKKVIILSILVHNTNQKANYLQCMLGIFLQSVHTPQKVVKTLAHMGLLISVTSISSVIQSLSRESNCTIKSLGCMMLAAYAYDNFDIDLKTSDQRVKKSNNTLKHLTSGLLFPLQHGISLDDLCCSQFLWEQSVNNIYVPETGRTYRDLLELHPESQGGASTLCQLWYNTWKILSDLAEHGPGYFQNFKDLLGELEFVEEIPVVKTLIIAACAMEFVNSTVSGNIQVITGLLAQARIHNLNEKDDVEMPDISDHFSHPLSRTY
ncbi:hypothetical protein EDD16DRAFT_1503407, partial [Pisolithus croceorrhizus]